ncbi:unnamed protein product [Prorocentrum cordatum]|uniref:EF-hand domain-containing protein n=1 Tax=Prorocentrum cordatum TaxID=2364126 RepID=A0ABN9PVS4_9DINO|nr:unnamed protein product [Polarella glacialis]
MGQAPRLPHPLLSECFDTSARASSSTRTLHPLFRAAAAAVSSSSPPGRPWACGAPSLSFLSCSLPSRASGVALVATARSATHAFRNALLEARRPTLHAATPGHPYKYGSPFHEQRHAGIGPGAFVEGAPDMVSEADESLIYNSPESAGVAYSTIRYGATCSNWDSISLQEHSYEASVASCAHTCSQASECTGFIFKPKACAAHEQFGPGSCFLYSEYCVETGDQCWDLYLIDAIQPPTPPPTPKPPTPSPPEPTPVPTMPPTTPEPVTPEPTAAPPVPTPEPTAPEPPSSQPTTQPAPIEPTTQSTTVPPTTEQAMTPEPTLSPTVAPTMAPVTPAGAGAASAEPATPPSPTMLVFAAQVGDDVVYLRNPAGITQGASLTFTTPDHSETHAVKGVNVGAVILDSAMEHDYPVDSTVTLRRASSPSPLPTPTPPTRSRLSSSRRSFPSFTWFLLPFAVIVAACLSLNFLGYTYSSDRCGRLVGDLKGRFDGCVGSFSARRMRDMGRQDMIKKVFVCFDRDGDTLLSSSELMLFASCLPHDPFIGSQREWDEHYSASIGLAHVDMERFRQLVDRLDPVPHPNGGEDGRQTEGDPGLSLYQTDDDLRSLLEMHSSDFRGYLVSSVFDAFDRDRDGVLSKEELRVFAESMAEEPFAGTAEDWEVFYAEVIDKQGQNGQDAAVDPQLFRLLVDDYGEDAPFGMSDVELAQMANSQMTATSLNLTLPLDGSQREQMISVLFEKFDRDGDGILSKEELMHLARSLPHDPFDGSPEDWHDMYQAYVREIGEPVDQERFAVLLDSHVFDDNPLELTDDEIMTMIWPEGEERGSEDDSAKSEGPDLPALPLQH